MHSNDYRIYWTFDQRVCLGSQRNLDKIDRVKLLFPRRFKVPLSSVGIVIVPTDDGVELRNLKETTTLLDMYRFCQGLSVIWVALVGRKFKKFKSYAKPFYYLTPTQWKLSLARDILGWHENRSMVESTVPFVFYSHEFHKDCIDRWLIARQTCPLCNYNILTGVSHAEEATQLWARICAKLKR